MKIKQYMTGPIQVNTYLAYDEETNKGFIVDPGGYSRQLTDDAKALGLTIDYIVLTHGHGDHIGGVEGHKKDFPEAKVVAHPDEVELLGDAYKNASVEMFPSPVTVTPDVLVKQGDILKVGSLELKIFHTPGHTKGGISVLADHVLFSGDTLFRFSIGRTDFWGGDFRTLMNSIKDRLFYLPDDTVVLPGHMRATTIGDEKRGNPFV